MIWQNRTLLCPSFFLGKDPVAIAGYVAGNIVSGAMPVVMWNQVQQMDHKNILLLDVRTRDEFAFGAIPGSVNIPLEELRSRIDELSADKEIYIYCAIGLRGYLALKILTLRGFKNVRNLSGGYKTYLAATAPVINRTASVLEEDKTEGNTGNMDNIKIKTVKIDACGLQCPGPIMKVKQAIDSIGEGNVWR